MSVDSQSAVERAARLCDVLEDIARAMVTLDNDALLAAEVRLADLVGAFDASLPAAGSDRATVDVVEATVRRGRTALMRCRRLGASFTGVARARASRRNRPDTYNRIGAVADPSAPSSTTVRATI